MSDRPRHTPQPNELFLAMWQQSIFAEGTTKPGTSDWGPAQTLHWARVWVDCCDLAGRLEEMEAKAATAKAAAVRAPEPWE